MTQDDMDAAMLWRTAMSRMAALSTEPTRHGYMRSNVEARLANYFAHIERMIARNPIPDTPGDRKRQSA
jgi:hypothetical protein